MTRNERSGVLAAVLSSLLGGSAAALTRYLVGAVDASALAAFRFGIAFVLILPFAWWLRSRWPSRRDWFGVAALGVLFFALFFHLYNTAIAHTTAARGSLALSTLPLTTMLVAALFGIEPLTLRKTAGVLVAISGVALALVGGLGEAPPGAWRGDAIMVGATVLMALYNVWSRPFVVRSSRLGFLAAGMGFGSVVNTSLAVQSGSFAGIAAFTGAQWAAVLCLGVLGGAAAFYLWAFALEHTTPTRVANTMAINPLAASLLAALLVAEPIGMPVVLGIGAVALGIWIAST